MDIVISHMAALHLIRSGYVQRNSWLECPTQLPQSMPAPADMRELLGLFPQLDALVGPIGVLVPTRQLAHHAQRARAHVWSKPLPAGALMQVAPGVRCASPLLLPLLMLPLLKPLELQLLLSELFGLYAPSRMCEMGLLQRREPLITPAELLGFLDAVGPIKGTTVLRKAISQAPVLAASPQEAKLFLRVTLPYIKGGYNLGEVVLNDAVEIQRLTARSKVMRKRKPDLLFLYGNAHVCLDYMGAWHDSENGVRRDTTRRNELLAAGFKPYELFKGHYDKLDYMDALAEKIRADLGMPRSKPSLELERKRRRARYELWRDLEAVDTTHWASRQDLR